jgi:GxxExxY protein
MEEDLKFNQLTRIIIGSAMKVHSFFGSGFYEKIYQRSLLIELEKSGLKVESEKQKEVFYEDRLVGMKRLDLIVENKVLVELKAVSELDKACFSSVLNYLKVFDLEVGLLLNFGKDSLQYKRFILSPNPRNPR